MRVFNELGALRTVCDKNSSLLSELKSAYPGVVAEADFEKLLKDEEIRGVVIAAPAVLHYSMAKEALLAGKDVMVEKPLALKVEEGRELVRLAKEKGKIVLVGHLLEYHPAVLKLKELVDRGDLGKIYYICSNRLNLGKIRTEENILWSFAPHDISVILLLMGGEMPQEISAHGGSYLNSNVADVTLTTMSFRDGSRAHIFVSWLHPFKEQKLVVVGEKKMALFDDTNPTNKLLLYPHEIEWVERRPVPRQKQAEVVEVSNQEPLKIECQDFLDCIKSRRKARVDGSKGLKVLEVLSNCQKSLEQGGTVIMFDSGDRSFFAHETSVLEQPYQIGEGTRIWHFTHLMPNVAIGKNCVIGQNVYIGEGVKIGNNVKIENNVSVFKGVTLEDDVFCGPSCVFTNVINPRSHVSRKHELKPTIVKRGASIGANATIVCGNSVGEYAFVGAGSVVTRDIPEHALVYGNPARQHGWMCQCGVKLDFGHDKKAKCSNCGKSYVIKSQKVLLIDDAYPTG